MRIQTLSVVIGDMACNASCPFCVSKMTPANGVPDNKPLNLRNLDIAIKLAKSCGVTTAMITGKGEPTLHWKDLREVICALQSANIPLIELQTNGLLLSSDTDDHKYNDYQQYVNSWRQRLYDMKNHGLTTIAISVVHWSREKNAEIYTPRKEYPHQLKDLVALLHEVGLSVRFSCIMLNGYVGDLNSFKRMIEFSQNIGVDQLTFIPVNKPLDTASAAKEISDWTTDHLVRDDELHAMHEWLRVRHNHILTLPHGAKVYDVNGQNVCMNHCLDPKPKNVDEIRNLIYYPSGRLAYDWQFEGSVIL